MTGLTMPRASVWDDAPLPFQSLDADGRLVSVNEPWCVFTGYSKDEAVGISYLDLIPEERHEEFDQNFAQIRRDGYIDSRECYLKLKSGEVRSVVIYGRMSDESDDAVTHCLLVDVTEHRHVAQALTESEERYRGLFQLAPNPVVVHDGRTIVLANAAVAAFLGFDSADELIGLPVADLVHPETANEVAARVRRMMTEDWVAPFIEEMFVRRDGSTAYGKTIAAPVTVGGRRMIHVAAIDLSERRDAACALAESEERFRQLFEHSVEPIVVHDGKYTLLANEAAYKFFGVPSEEGAGGVEITRFIHPDDVAEVQRRVALLIAGGQSLAAIELRVVRADGAVFEAEARTSSIALHGETLLKTTFRDLTAAKKSQRELARYRLQLEELLAERTSRLERAQVDLEAITAVVARTVEMRDPYTAGHQRRVAELSVAIALHLGMSDEQTQTVNIAASMHDIGKISVPAEILSKPGRFSAVEFELVKEHSQAGYDILSSAEVAHEVAEMVRQHHERLDGSGYPQGLTREQLSSGSCVLMVADVVEAISSHRPYRPAIGVEAALLEIETHRGVLFAPEVVDSCLAVFAQGFVFSAA